MIQQDLFIKSYSGYLSLINPVKPHKHKSIGKKMTGLNLGIKWETILKRFSVTFFLIILMTVNLLAQPKGNSSETRPSLDLRFQTLKTESQTVKRKNQVYKVFKENVLDSFWKTVKDTLHKQQQILIRNNAQIATLTRQKDAAEQMLAVQNADMQEVLFDSNHITIMGISFTKVFFILIFMVLIGGLVFLLSISIIRMKYVTAMKKENELLLESVSNEFEVFKRKSLERQTKLSRQLQDERNKLYEDRNSKMQEMKIY